MSQPTLAFLGLGVMGGPMAGWLVKNGHQMRVWNRTPAKAEAWAQSNPGEVAETIAQAVAGVDFVMACVGDDPDARAVALKAFEAMKPGAIYVDHTTTSAALSKELALAASKAGLDWLDAPVSGGQAGAINGRLTAMCGGSEATFERAKPVLSAYCGNIVRIGEAGAGQLAKMVNQIAIAGVVQGLAEAVSFAKAQELDTDAVLAAISKGAAGSWQMENRWATMVEDRYDFGFAVDWMRKDLRIVLEAAQTKGLDLALTQMVDGYYAEIQADGGGRLDTSSLAKRFTSLRKPD
ncbi:MAG: NAD(P)-dependent oxidoreductase [Aquidulcibacter sp.]